MYLQLALQLEEVAKQEKEITPQPQGQSGSSGGKKDHWKTLKTHIKTVHMFSDAGKSAKHERALQSRLNEIEKTIREYQIDIVVMKEMIEIFLSSKRGTPQKQYLLAFSTEFKRQSYQPTYPMSNELGKRTEECYTLLETDLRRNKDSARNLAKFITNTEFNKFFQSLQSSLTPQEIETLKGKLTEEQKERVHKLSNNKGFEANIIDPNVMNVIKAVQIPVKYPLLIADSIKPLKELVKLKESV